MLGEVVGIEPTMQGRETKNLAKALDRSATPPGRGEGCLPNERCPYTIRISLCGHLGRTLTPSLVS